MLWIGGGTESIICAIEDGKRARIPNEKFDSCDNERIVIIMMRMIVVERIFHTALSISY